MRICTAHFLLQAGVRGRCRSSVRAGDDLRSFLPQNSASSCVRVERSKDAHLDATVAMASTLVAMASNLRTMASIPRTMAP